MSDGSESIVRISISGASQDGASSAVSVGKSTRLVAADGSSSIVVIGSAQPVTPPNQPGLIEVNTSGGALQANTDDPQQEVQVLL